MLESAESTREITGMEIGGVPCKELPDPTKKRFRGLWLRPPA